MSEGVQVRRKLVDVSCIPHREQRYETCGDWQKLGETLKIRVSDTGDRFSNLLVGLHEMVEAILCEAQGVSEIDVDNFDMLFEKLRVEGNLEEPGDHPSAPYHHQHKIADIVERLVAVELGINWEEHCARVEALG